jgi:hypothetical protein
LGFALYYHGAFGILDLLGAYMLHTLLPVGSEEIETQTVMRRIDAVKKLPSHDSPLCRIHEALEHRVLDALPIIEAGFGNTSETTGPMIILCDIVAHEYHHLSLPDECRVAIEIAA